MPRILLDHCYEKDALADIEGDVASAIEDAEDIPVDEYGFSEGTYRVVITWEPGE